MGLKANIRIQTADGNRLDYSTPESLGIKFNRIADDYTDIKKRWGEFSYAFSLPKTKKNEKILGYPSTNSNQRKFGVNPIGISVFNNDALLLSGNLELQRIKADSYECRFYSELTQLLDALEDVDLQDITGFEHIENWNEETTIRNHTNANYQSSDDCDYQFPLVFYSTWFTPYAAYEGLTDSLGYAFRAEGDRAMQNHYYLLNTTQNGTTLCERYHHEFPLTFYLKSLLEKLLEHVGWSLSGSFWETESVKKILLMFSGEEDLYDAARYTSGGTTYLDPNVFIPKYKAKKFLSDVINTFNLFLFVDLNNKILSMETYDTVFGSRIAALDLNNKILEDSVENIQIENPDPSIEFTEPDNTGILGDNYFIAENSVNALTTNYYKTDNSKFDSVYNHIGTSNARTQVGFAAPPVKRMFLRNTSNYDNSVTNANDSVVFLPNMSKQTPQDNNNKKFNGASGDTKVYNDEEWIKTKQTKPCLMYYYGISTSDFVQQSTKGSSSDYFYYNFDNTKQKIGFASPFAWRSYRAPVESELSAASSGKTSSIYASYLQSIYMMMGTGYTGTTDYSLVFGDSHGMADTLYTKFYQNRMTRYRDSEVLSAGMRLNDMDWIAMQFNQPLLYKGQYYSLMSIKNYDVVTGVAQIEMIKMM